jgi:hypothetical protein
MGLEECIIVRRISTELGPARRKDQHRLQKDAGRETWRTYKVPSPQLKHSANNSPCMEAQKFSSFNMAQMHSNGSGQRWLTMGASLCLPVAITSRKFMCNSPIEGRNYEACLWCYSSQLPGRPWLSKKTVSNDPWWRPKQGFSFRQRATQTEIRRHDVMPDLQWEIGSNENKVVTRDCDANMMLCIDKGSTPWVFDTSLTVDNQSK